VQHLVNVLQQGLTRVFRIMSLVVVTGVDHDDHSVVHTKFNGLLVLLLHAPVLILLLILIGEALVADLRSR